MENKFESIFSNLTDSQFEDILKECGFKFKKVQGEGGLFIGGKRIYSHELKEEYIRITKMYSKESYLIEDNLNENFKNFEIREEYMLVA